MTRLVFEEEFARDRRLRPCEENCLRPVRVVDEGSYHMGFYPLQKCWHYDRATKFLGPVTMNRSVGEGGWMYFCM